MPPQTAPETVADLEEAQARWKAEEFGAAELLCRKVLRQNPRQPEALFLLGRILLRVGNPAFAVAFLQQAVSVQPDAGAYHETLGLALMQTERSEAAVGALERAVALRPQRAGTLVNLALALKQNREYQRAVAALHQALELEPDRWEARVNLGGVLCGQGLVAEGVDWFDPGDAPEPFAAQAHSNQVFALHYLPECGPESLLAAAKCWSERHANPLTAAAPPHLRPAQRDRRLRVGYVSADLHEHPVGRFLAPVLAAHDRSQFEIFAYSNGPRVDRLSQKLRAHCDHWRGVAGLTDAALANQIRADKIDLLIDLAGHTAGNRLLAFARKPAPVQATWLGYPGTTGMTAMDYLIANEYACPERYAAHYSERVIRLPGSNLWCYGTPLAPDVSPPPYLNRGSVTFGCFNNIAKVGQQVIALWSEVLHAVPGSRLLLKTAALAEADVRARFEGWFTEHGIDSERVELEGVSCYREYLEAFARVDIALDPFPFNGGTVTVDGLWMGVPAVSLAGDRFAGRLGVSHLHSAGLDDLVAATRMEYIQKAADLADDRERLASIRSSLRTRLSLSPLGDATAFAAALEDAYRRMWLSWCDGRDAAPHSSETFQP